MSCSFKNRLTAFGPADGSLAPSLTRSAIAINTSASSWSKIPLSATPWINSIIAFMILLPSLYQPDRRYLRVSLNLAIAFKNLPSLASVKTLLTLGWILPTMRLINAPSAKMRSIVDAMSFTVCSSSTSLCSPSSRLAC